MQLLIFIVIRTLLIECTDLSSCFWIVCVVLLPSLLNNFSMTDSFKNTQQF